MSLAPGSEDRPPSGLVTRGGKLKFGVGIGLSAVLLVLIAQRVDAGQVLAALRGVPSWALAGAGLMLVLDFAAKIARWRLMLRPLAPGTTWRAAGQTLIASIALNNLLPLRAGDVARAFGFRSVLGVGPSGLVPLLVLERLLDTVMLLVLAAGVTIPLAHDGVLPHELGFVPYLSAAVIIGTPWAIAAFVGLMRHFKSRYESLGLSQSAARALEAVETQLGGMHVASLLALTAAAWVAECLMFCVLAAGFGIAQPLTAGSLACAMATLSGLIPSAPGAFGTFHAAAIAAVVLMGATTDTATAYALVVHAMMWLPLTLAGVACLTGLSAKTSNPQASQESA